MRCARKAVARSSYRVPFPRRRRRGACCGASCAMRAAIDISNGETGMTTKAVGPGKGWDWLMRAANLGSQNAKALFGAAAWLMAIALVPTLVQMALQKAMPES